VINLGDAVLFFKGDMNDLDRALGDARTAAEGSLGNIKQLCAETGAAMTAMGASIAGVLGLAVTDFANTGDEVNDLSKKIGFTTEAVSKWSFALGQSGGDMSMLQTGVRGLANQIDGELNKALTDTGEATDGTASAFQRLGLDAAALKQLAPEDQFMKVALAVAAVNDPMERAVLAQDMFGKAGMDLLPVLAEGEAGLRAMFDQAERAGAVFSQEQADMADAYNDALGELSASASGVGKELAVALIPSLIETIGWVKENVIAFKDWAQANPETVATLVKVGAAVSAFLLVAGPLLMVLPGIATAASMVAPAIGAIGAVIGVVAGVITAPIALIIAGVTAIGLAAWGVYENWEAVSAFFGDFWGNMAALFQDGAQMISSSDWFAGLKESAASATEYSIGVLGELAGWVSGNLYQALTDPVTFIAEYWDYLGGVFDSVYSSIAAGFNWVMETVLRPAWDWMKEFYAWISEIFMGAFDTAAGNAQNLAPDTVPGFASGTRSAPGGMAWVGERGPELVFLPKGAQVNTAEQSAAMAGGGGATVNISIGAVSLPSRAAIQEFNRGLGDEVARRLSARGMQPRIA
jgi:hypothetical protein